MSLNRSFNLARAMAGFVLCAGAAGIVHAQSAPATSAAQGVLDATFVFNLGGFLVNTDTKARLNGSSASNPEVDFDRTFGKASDETRIRADALWRITPTHHLRFLYFDNTIDRSRVISENIKWGDLEFQAGANVLSQTEFKIVELAYEYAFMRRPGFELAGSVGVHYMDLSLGLSGSATLTNPDGTVSTSAVRSKSSSVPVPLPVIGVRAAWAVSPQWLVDVQGQVFKAKFDEYDGRVTDLRASATWMYSPHFGVGLGYNTFITKVDVDKASYNGRVHVGYSGLQLFLTGAF